MKVSICGVFSAFRNLWEGDFGAVPAVDAWVPRECGGIRWVSVSVRPTWDEATSLDLRDGARDVFARWGKDGSDPDP